MRVTVSDHSDSLTRVLMTWLPRRDAYRCALAGAYWTSAGERALDQACRCIDDCQSDCDCAEESGKKCGASDRSRSSRKKKEEGGESTTVYWDTRSGNQDDRYLSPDEIYLPAQDGQPAVTVDIHSYSFESDTGGTQGIEGGEPKRPRRTTGAGGEDDEDDGPSDSMSLEDWLEMERESGDVGHGHQGLFDIFKWNLPIVGASGGASDAPWDVAGNDDETTSTDYEDPRDGLGGDPETPRSPGGYGDDTPDPDDGPGKTDLPVLGPDSRLEKGDRYVLDNSLGRKFDLLVEGARAERGENREGFQIVAVDGVTGRYVALGEPMRLQGLDHSAVHVVDDILSGDPLNNLPEAGPTPDVDVPEGFAIAGLAHIHPYRTEDVGPEQHNTPSANDRNPNMQFKAHVTVSGRIWVQLVEADEDGAWAIELTGRRRNDGRWVLRVRRITAIPGPPTFPEFPD